MDTPWTVLAEIYLCRTCSCHEILRRNAQVATPGTSAGDLLTAFAGKMQHTIATMAAKRHEQVRFPLRFRILIVIRRSKDEMGRNVGESQSLPWF